MIYRAILSVSIRIHTENISRVATVCPCASLVPSFSKLGGFAASMMVFGSEDMQSVGKAQNDENVQLTPTVDGKQGLPEQHKVRIQSRCFLTEGKEGSPK